MANGIIEYHQICSSYLLTIPKLASLIDEISKINTVKDKQQDIVGRVYEYFLSKFALAEGKGKGEFYMYRPEICLYYSFFVILHVLKTE